jgi:hypothetical protein
MSSDPNSSDYQPDESAGAADGAGGEESPDFNAGGDNTDFVISEPKKQVNMTTLVLFGLIALGGGALYLMHLRTGPAEASAANPQANATVEQFLSGGQTNIIQMERMLRDTQKVVDQFLTYPSVTQIPLTALQTNPFRQLLDKGPDTSATEAEAKRKKEEERLAIKTAAEALQLQFVMSMGAKSSCMINNRQYREGQQIDGGFTVEKINANSVVVKNGTYRFELKMQR